VDPSWPRLVLSGNLPRLQLHFNEEKVFTLKHFLGRLLNPDFAAAAQPAGSAASFGGGEARSRPASPVPAADETLALFNDWQPGGDVDLSARLFVAQFLVSDLSVEIQSQVRIEMWIRGILKRLSEVGVLLGSCDCEFFFEIQYLCFMCFWFGFEIPKTSL
jgi:hypothetical protein